MKFKTAIISAAIIATIWVTWSVTQKYVAENTEENKKANDAGFANATDWKVAQQLGLNTEKELLDWRYHQIIKDATTKAGQAGSNTSSVADETASDADRTALIKVMKDAVAARHGGTLPKTMSEADTKVAALAATKWKAKQAAEKTKRELDAMKVKPPPSSGYAEIYLAKEAITKMMRDPASAVFGDVFFVDDRKSPTGYYVPVVCGTVNGKNGFGGMTGQMHFVAVMSDVASGVWMEGTTPQNVFAPEWNRYCAGQHD